MGYSAMFGDQVKGNPVPAPMAPTNTNLFGEAKTQDTILKDIQVWREFKGVKTPAGKIKFALGGLDATKMTPSDISVIGEHHVAEATEANKCVDQVVTDFAAMKGELEGPKSLILAAVNVIESASKPQGFIERFKGVKPPTWAETRAWVKDNIDQASDKMKNVTKYHLEPFIEGLTDAKFYLTKISEGIDQTISALDYVIEKSTEPTVQDLARRRKEMFAKSYQLMLLNESQLDAMMKTCEQNKHFATELEMTLKPLIENVMRSQVVNGTSDEQAMKDIQLKLKGIL